MTTITRYEIRGGRITGYVELYEEGLLYERPFNRVFVPYRSIVAFRRVKKLLMHPTFEVTTNDGKKYELVVKDDKAFDVDMTSRLDTSTRL